MDKRIRKYILYKAKTLDERKKELRRLKEKRAEMERALGSISISLDGLPKGKGKVGTPTETEALRFVELDRRIARLEEEIQVFTTFEQRVTGLQREVYIETVKKNCIDLTAKAQQIGMGRRQLIQARGKILSYIAKELGEYFDNE